MVDRRQEVGLGDVDRVGSSVFISSRARHSHRD